MADKRIDELEEAYSITGTDLFVLEQANTAKKLSGQTMTTFLLSLAQGHGGISSIAKTGSTGTNPVVDTYTITFADASTTTFEVTNGLRGPTGATGAQGPKGDSTIIAYSSVQYQEGSSGTAVPTGTWVDSVPSVSQGSYLWTRTIINYSDGTGVTSYSVARMGVDGTGAVSTVNNISPDGNGNISLSAADVGAMPSGYTPPVTSVNGKTGTVALTASDVGALPSSYEAPVSSVQGRTGAVTIGLSDIAEIVNVEGGGTHVFALSNLTRHVFFVIGGAADNLCIVLVGVTSAGAVRNNKIGTASNITVTNGTNQVSIKSASYAATILHLEYAGE